MIAGLMLAVQVSAEMFSYDGFEYTPGTQLRYCTNQNIEGSSVWKLSGTAPNAVVTSGGLSYPGLAASTGNSITNAGNYSSTTDYTYLTNQNFMVVSQIFASVIIKVTDLSGLTTNVQPLFALKNKSENLVGIRTNANRPGNFDVGIASNLTDLVEQNYWSKWDDNGGEGYYTGDSILVVMGYWFGYVDAVLRVNGYLWVNPRASTFGGPQPWCGHVAQLSYYSTFTAAPFYMFGYNGAKVQMDELRLGRSYADVTPTGTVHEASTFFTY
jgi:hypothetical protein